jgi:cholesterol oxidase
MERLSSFIGSLKSHYPVVVVGSGYGGAIAASRLARAGQKVCLLERGREFQPGEYPNRTISAATHFQIDGPDLRRGAPTALYDLRLNPDIDVFLGCGLGGTSLVNANVALRPDPRLFEDLCWPQALRADLDGGVAQGYARAEAMLTPSPYPESAPPLPKLVALEASAAALGGKFSRPPINVTFESGVNQAGVYQHACNCCGDCCSGCNYGAKNTVLMNYLPDAVNHGAEIYTTVSVRSLTRQGDRWLINYQLTDADRERFDAPELTLTADMVILSAGTLGSTEILLRSRQRAGVTLSDHLGRGFSGNGDVLAFAYNADWPINGVGFGDKASEGREPVGPCITGLIDLRDKPEVDDGMVIEEGSIPGGLASVLPAALASGARLEGHKAPSFDAAAALAREAESTLRGAYAGAVRNTQTFLLMAHDGAGGVMSLVRDRLRISWADVSGLKTFENADEALKRASEPLGGEYLRNPAWKMLDNLISVHPLGGCAMAEDAAHGVVNHQGQVFAGASGAAVHPGLYVSDGSIMPRSLGVNPLLTISALTERCCAIIAAEKGWTIDYAPKPAKAAKPAAAGLQFTERMAGFWSPKVTDEDYEKAAAQGKQDESRMAFVLTIVSSDLYATIKGSTEPSAAIGTVEIPALSPKPLTVHDGKFNFFVDDPEHVETKRMLYALPLTAVDGTQYFLCAFKVFQPSAATRTWAESTTAYVTLHQGGDEGGPVIGRGILRISPADFQTQMLTMRATNLDDEGARLEAIAHFTRFFAGELVDFFGGVFAHPSLFDPGAPPRQKRLLRTGAPEIQDFVTSDGLPLRLSRYRGGAKGPVVLGHAYGVSSTMFSVDTIDTNFVEYLYAQGYDVWALDFRASPIYNNVPNPLFRQYTLDDIALHDWPAAIAKVRAVTRAKAVQVVAHCIGSVSFFMAMLSGMEGVESAIACQVAAHPIPAWPGRLKSALHLPSVLYHLGLKTFPTDENTQSSFGNQLLDRALRLTTPLQPGDECNSPVCWRVNFLYGVSFLHSQLNDATHKAIHEFFGFASLPSLSHIARIVRAGHVIAADGSESYMPHLDRLKLPILFVQGLHNEVFIPPGTKKTYETLVAANGKDYYERIVFPTYGHLDCFIGRNAAADIYPTMLRHLDRTRQP